MIQQCFSFGLTDSMNENVVAFVCPEQSAIWLYLRCDPRMYVSTEKQLQKISAALHADVVSVSVDNTPARGLAGIASTRLIILAKILLKQNLRQADNVRHGFRTKKDR